MKKLLLILAATSCAYLQANASFYTDLSLRGVHDLESCSSKSVSGSLTINVGYDILTSNNFYMALERNIVFIKKAEPENFSYQQDLLNIQFGYQIKKNLVLLYSIIIGVELEVSNNTNAVNKLDNPEPKVSNNIIVVNKLDNPYIFHAIGVKYFDEKQSIAYKALVQFRKSNTQLISDDGFSIGILLGCEYRF